MTWPSTYAHAARLHCHDPRACAAVAGAADVDGDVVGRLLSGHGLGEGDLAELAHAEVGAWPSLLGMPAGLGRREVLVGERGHLIYGNGRVCDALQFLLWCDRKLQEWL